MMSKTSKNTAHALNSRMALSTALASIVLGGYGGRNAYAACTGAAGTYTCSDPTFITQALPTIGTSVLNVTTDPGFSIVTGAGNAFTLTGTGGLTFTDNNFSTITGDDAGIEARNYGAGSLSITSTGMVEGTNIDGIRAENHGTDLRVETAAVKGEERGIYTRNYGTGSLSITSTGMVEGTSRNALYALNSSNGTDLTIETADVKGNTGGIDANNFGTGSLSITSTGIVETRFFNAIDARNEGTDLTIETAAVKGKSRGIRARNFGTGSLSITSTVMVEGDTFYGIEALNHGTDLTIETAEVKGGFHGIKARNEGTGSLSITSTGLVEGISHNGIDARNYSTGTNLTIETAAVTGDDYGIDARNYGSGILSITTDAAITGGTAAGITTFTNAGQMTYITLNSGASVSSTSGYAIANNHGDSLTIVNTGASVTGHIILDDGSDDLTFDGGDFSGVTLFDGGDDASIADGWIDHLTFANVNGSVNSTIIQNWEALTLSTADITLSGAFLAPPTLNVINGSRLLVNGDLTSGGLISMQDGKAGDIISVDGNFIGSGQLLIDADLDSNLADLLEIASAVQGTPTTISAKGWGTASGNPILLVDTDGPTSLGDFLLDGLPIGAYSFDLGLLSDGWYLTNPVWSPNTPTYDAYPQILAALNTLPTLKQRAGDRYLNNSQNSAINDDRQPGQQSAVSTNGSINLVSSASHGIWLRIEGAHSHIEPKSSTTASQYDVDSWKVQAGVDGLLYENADGRLIGGFNGYYGTASADVFSTFGNGMIDTDASGVGVTLTWYGNDGFYADGQAQWSQFDSDLSSSVFGSLTNDNEGTGRAYSLEIGKRIESGNGLSFTPQAQLVYGEIDFDTFIDNVSGAVVSLGKAENARLRLGVASEINVSLGDGSRASLFGIGNVYYDFGDGTAVSVSGARLTSVLDGWSAEIGLGGSLQSADDRIALFGEATITTSLENFGASHSYRGIVGVRANF